MDSTMVYTFSRPINHRQIDRSFHKLPPPRSLMDSTPGGAAAVSMGSGNNGVINSQLNNDAGSAASTPAAANSASDDAKQNLSNVINSTDKILALLHQLHLTVSTFTVSSQLPLLQRLNGLVVELESMAKLSEKCNIQVPMEVLNLIDDGKNPDEFTRDVINGCIVKNQITKGKTDSFKSLRKHLLEELEQTFPEEVDAYREIRAASAAEMKRISQQQSALPNGDVKVKNEL